MHLNRESVIRSCAAMGDFTYAENADMHYMYDRATGHGKAALRMYHAQFPNRRMPDHRMFQRLHRQLRETQSSTRAVAHHVSVSHQTACRELNENRLRCFHFQRAHSGILSSPTARGHFSRKDRIYKRTVLPKGGRLVTLTMVREVQTPILKPGDLRSNEVFVEKYNSALKLLRQEISGTLTVAHLYSGMRAPVKTALPQRPQP
ncbi:hypothetical protein TNCV_4955061 [Trichonephila clavipes]|nr:hypothetical protein TNCV_4955061 [Trichonephila clavipes]